MIITQTSAIAKDVPALLQGTLELSGLNGLRQVMAKRKTKIYVYEEREGKSNANVGNKVGVASEFFGRKTAGVMF